MTSTPRQTSSVVDWGAANWLELPSSIRLLNWAGRRPTRRRLSHCRFGALPLILRITWAMVLSVDLEAARATPAATRVFCLSMHAMLEQPSSTSKKIREKSGKIRKMQEKWRKKHGNKTVMKFWLLFKFKEFCFTAIVWLKRWSRTGGLFFVITFSGKICAKFYFYTKLINYKWRLFSPKNQLRDSVKFFGTI